jgi:hypothetical protein
MIATRTPRRTAVYQQGAFAGILEESGPAGAPLRMMLSRYQQSITEL